MVTAYPAYPVFKHHCESAYHLPFRPVGSYNSGFPIVILFKSSEPSAISIFVRALLFCF